MYEGDRIGVVVPAYNEARFVGEVLSTVPAFVDVVIAVDDCSDDGTWQVMRAVASAMGGLATEAASASDDWKAADSASTSDGGMGSDSGSGRDSGQPVELVSATDGGAVSERRSPSDGGMSTDRSRSTATPDIVTIRHQTNKGRGAAVKTGYQVALNRGLDVVAVMDGDNQMDPAILERILAPVVSGDVDYVKGNRLASREQCAAMPRWRLFGNAMLTMLTKVASGHWGMRDPQNGYTAISATALEQIDIQSLYDDYGFLNDLLIRLGAHDLRVADVPMTAIYGDESSGIRYRSFVPSLSLLLLRRYLWRLRVQYAGSGSSRSDSADG